MNTKKLFLFFIIFILITTILLKLFLGFTIPIGEDDAYYGFRAQQVNNGKTLHSEGLYSHHGSLTIYFLSFFSIFFGLSALSIRFAAFFVDIALILTIFLITKKYFKIRLALLASTIYAVVSLTLGAFKYSAESLSALFGLIAIFFYFSYLDKDNETSLYLVGLFIGFSIWFKQPGIFFFLAIFIHQLYFYFKKQKNYKSILKPLVKIIIGILIISIPLSIYFFYHSGFNFIKDLIIYPFLFSTANSRILVIGKLIRMFLFSFGFLFILILAAVKSKNNQKITFLWIYSIIITIFLLINREIFAEHLIHLAPFLIILFIYYLKKYPQKSLKLIRILIIVSLLSIFMVSLEKTARDYRENEKLKQENIIEFMLEEIPQGSQVYSVSEKYIFLSGYQNPYKWTSLSPFIESVENFEDFCEFVEEVDYIIFVEHQKKYLGEKNLECVYSKFIKIKEFEDVAESSVEILKKISK